MRDNKNRILKFFSQYIEKELGIVFEEINYFQLKNRLNKICKTLEIKDLEVLYLKGLKSINGLFKQLLLDVSTNNETSFFRDSKTFVALEKKVIPKFMKENPHAKRINIWSCASSFGKKIFTLKILRENMYLKNQNVPIFDIQATDISEKALKRTREGIDFQLEVQRGLNALHLIRHFDKGEENHWIIKES